MFAFVANGRCQMAEFCLASSFASPARSYLELEITRNPAYSNCSCPFSETSILAESMLTIDTLKKSSNLPPEAYFFERAECRTLGTWKANFFPLVESNGNKWLVDARLPHARLTKIVQIKFLKFLIIFLCEIHPCPRYYRYYISEVLPNMPWISIFF